MIGDNGAAMRGFGLRVITTWMWISAMLLSPAHGQDGRSSDAGAVDIESRLDAVEAIISTEPEAAIETLMALLEEAPDPSSAAYARIQFGLGLANYHRTFYSLAKQYFNQALETSHAQNNLDMLARLYNNLGVVNDLSRDYDQALQSYQRALEIEAERDRPLEVAEIYNNISLIYYNLGQSNDALNALERAQTYVGDETGSLIQGLIYQNQAINFYDLEQYDEYLAASNAALEIYRQQGQTLSELQVYFNLIEDGFRRTQDWAFIKTTLDGGMAKARSQNLPIMLAYFTVQKGKLALLEGNLDQAVADFEQSVAIFEELGFQAESLPDDLYLWWIEAYAKLGEPDAVMAKLQEFRAAERSREMGAQRNTINELKVQLEFNEQANELQQRTIELQREQARNLWLGFLSLSSLLIIIGLVSYHRIRLRNLENLYKLNRDALKRRDAERTRRENEVAPQDVMDEPSMDGDDDLLKAQRLRFIFDRVERVMTNEELYKQAGLTLPDLAQHVGFSKRLVSEAINLCAELSFPEYLSQHRVVFAMHLLDDVEQMHRSIDQILDEAGFSSRSAFYAAFKKGCGMTPKEYRKMSLRQPGRTGGSQPTPQPNDGHG